jgi:hypothetical protein
MDWWTSYHDEGVDTMSPEDRDAIQSMIDAAERRITTNLTSVVVAAEQRAAERARDLQTEALRGLEAFARGNFARFHSVESNQTDLNTRMAALEERVLYLETRRPPQ